MREHAGWVGRQEPGEHAKLAVALAAQDAKQDQLLALLREFQPVLVKSRLVATQGTGALAGRWLELPVERVKSGHAGGVVQIAAMVAQGAIDAVVYLRDPLTAQPHDSDIDALLRLCDVHEVPFATNAASARCLLAYLAAHDLTAGGHPAAGASKAS